MKNIKKLSFLLLIPFLFACNGNDSSKSYSETFTIYSLNDSHGDLLRDKDVGAFGLDAVSAMIKKENVDNPSHNYFTICTGDMFQGQYVSNETKGEAVIDALNYLNCKAFAFGNHEFDWSIEAMHKYKDGNLENGEFNGEFLGANIIQKSINKRPDWIKPYTIVEQNGHKIGIIGFIGEEIETSVQKDMIADYEFVETLPLYNQYSKELKDVHHCDLIVSAIHDYGERYKAFATSEVPCQTIFGGHTHKKELEYITNPSCDYKIPFIEGGYSNEFVSKVKYTFKNKQVSNIEASHLTNDIPDDQIDIKLTDMITGKYKNIFDKYNRVICHNFKHMTRDEWIPFIGKILAHDVDVGCINKGGIRGGTEYATDSNLYYKQLYKIMPFDNLIYQVTIEKSIIDNYAIDNPKTEVAFSDGEHFGDFYTVNVVDYVYEHPRDAEIWNQSTMVKTLDGYARDYVAHYLEHLESNPNK